VVAGGGVRPGHDPATGPVRGDDRLRHLEEASALADGLKNLVVVAAHDALLLGGAELYGSILHGSAPKSNFSLLSFHHF